MFQKFNLDFWIVVAVAVTVRLVASDKLSLFASAVSVLNAIFVAVVFTHPVIDLLGLNQAVYTLPIASLLALTGQGLTKVVITYTESPARIIEAIRAWKGK